MIEELKVEDRDYKDFVEHIAEKHGYNDEIYGENFKPLLSEIIKQQIRYYGKDYEKLILDTYENTPIIKADKGENLYDVIQKYKPEEIIQKDDGAIVSERVLKIASGVHFSFPDIKYSHNKVPELTGKKSFIGINSYFDINNSTNVVTLIHELNHAIKANINEFNIKSKDGKYILVTRSGIAETQEEILRDENGNVVLTYISQLGIGLNEGKNEYDSLLIAEKVLGEKQESKGYGIITALAEKFCNIGNLGRLLSKAELNPNLCDFEKAYEKPFEHKNGQYKDFLKESDSVYEYALEMFKNMFNPEARDESKLKLLDVIETAKVLLKEREELENLIK